MTISLYRSQYIEKKINPDGSFNIFLTEKGNIKAINCKFPELMKTKKWDNRWRIVVFDVPERIRKGRDALRHKLREIGFHKLQESVFVFPYECSNEVHLIVKFFKMEKNVYYGVLEKIDNDRDLKKVFGLM